MQLFYNICIAILVSGFHLILIIVIKTYPYWYKSVDDRLPIAFFEKQNQIIVRKVSIAFALFAIFTELMTAILATVFWEAPMAFGLVAIPLFATIQMTVRSCAHYSMKTGDVPKKLELAFEDISWIEISELSIRIGHKRITAKTLLLNGEYYYTQYRNIDLFVEEARKSGVKVYIRE